MAFLNACFMTTIFTFVLLGGIMGAEFATRLSMSTLPISIYVAGTAVSIIPISMLMDHYGRRIGFVVGALSGIAGGVCILHSSLNASFLTVNMAGFFVGVLTASSSFLRFAALEVSPEHLHGRSASMVLSGGIVAAFFGTRMPTMVESTFHVNVYNGLGISMIAVNVLALVICPIIGFRTSLSRIAKRRYTTSMHVSKLVRLFDNTNFTRAVIACVGGYALMILLMNAAPLIITMIHEHPFQVAESVLTYHYLAMFVPFLVSGYLLDKIGIDQIVYIGLLLLFICVAFIFILDNILSFYASLICLGVGWNFLFIGGTTLLFQSISQKESHYGQRVNELLTDVFNFIASISVGFLLFNNGLRHLATTFLAVLVMVTLAYVYFSRRSPVIEKST